MEDSNLYETVATHNQGASYERRGGNDGKMYMVPNTARLDEENQYEELQIGTAPSKKQSASQQCTSLGADLGVRTKDKVIEKKRGCIAICMLITVLAVITFTALAVGALSLKGSSKAQLAVDALTEESVNYTYLMDEISALKSLLCSVEF